MKMFLLSLTEIGKMHTYIFRDFNDLRDPEGKHGCHFRPTKTHVSEKYGRHFFIDIGMHFVSAPSLEKGGYCLLYTSPSPRDKRQSRMPSSA